MFCIIIRKLVFCVVFCTSLYRLSWSLFIILTVLSSVLIIVCHFDCCIVCPDHCLSFWLLYRLSWSLFVILTVVLSVLIIVCHFDCCIVCPDHCLPFWLLYRLSFDKRVMITPCWCLQTFLEWHVFTQTTILLVHNVHACIYYFSLPYPKRKPYFGYLIASVEYCLAWSPRVRWIFGSSPHRVKRTSLKLVCVASPLNTQH